MESTDANDQDKKRTRYRNLAALIIVTLVGMFITTATVTTLYNLENVMQFILLHYYKTATLITTLTTVTSVTCHKLGSDGRKKIYKLVMFGINSALASILLLKIPREVLMYSFKITGGAVLAISIVAPFIPQRAFASIPRPMQSLNFITLMTAMYGSKRTKDMPSTKQENASKYGGLVAYSSLLAWNLNTFLMKIKDPNFDYICAADITYVNMLSLYLKVISFMFDECTFELYCADMETTKPSTT